MLTVGVLCYLRCGHEHNTDHTKYTLTRCRSDGAPSSKGHARPALLQRERFKRTVARAKAKAEPTPPRPRANNPDCRLCNLQDRSRTVCCPGSGPLTSAIWLFGEALGATEEELGRPFVGDAGRKLNYLLARSGLKRKAVRVENVVRCRPPGNRKPSKKQIEACWGYSLQVILKHKPKVIVAMGATAVEALVSQNGQRYPVDDWRGFYQRRTFSWTSPKTGKVHEHTCWVVPTYHPSLCLRKWEADDLFVFDLLTAQELAAGREPQSWPDTKVTVIKTKAEAIAFLRHLRRVEGFVLDIEDTSLQVHQSTVMCFGFCYKAGHATILPLHTQGDPPVPVWKPHELAEIIAELTITLETGRVYGQNIKYDLQRCRKLTGLVDYEVGFDTMIAHHVLDENKPHNLTFLCQWYLGWQKYDAVIDPYKDGKRVRMWLVPDQIRHTYCGFDVDGTFRIRKILEPELAEEGVDGVYRIEHDLILPLADMEYRGIHLDAPRIVELSERYRGEAAKALARLQRIAKRAHPDFADGFNPGSPPQLAFLLKHCGASLRKRTKGGGVSVDKFVLGALSLKKTRAGAVARAVMQFRKVEKYTSTYLDGVSVAKKGRGRPSKGDGGFLRWVQEHDRIHTNYNIAIARTGRLSADDPPIQTIPRIGDLRSILIPDIPGEHVLIAVDYEKLELCVMAWLANDAVMVEELLSGVDLHTKMAITARLMRNPTKDELEAMWDSVSKNERAIAKGVNFGIPYGRGAGSIAEQNPDAFPLGMRPAERRERVQKVIDAFFQKYEGITIYRERQMDKLHARGYLRTTVHKRVRRLYGINWFESTYAEACEKRDYDLSHLEREGLNCEIQSIGSDTLSEATKRVYDGMKRARLEAFRIIMSLHDALIFNVHKRHADRAIPLIKKWMEVTLPRDKRHRYNMPLRVDCTVQSYWGEGES